TLAKCRPNSGELFTDLSLSTTTSQPEDSNYRSNYRSVATSSGFETSLEMLLRTNSRVETIPK
ncbi:hypothetical protein MTR67_003111, partial [Solanum verrucosum]